MIENENESFSSHGNSANLWVGPKSEAGGSGKRSRRGQTREPGRDKNAKQVGRASEAGRSGKRSGLGQTREAGRDKNAERARLDKRSGSGTDGPCGALPSSDLLDVLDVDRRARRELGRRAPAHDAALDVEPHHACMRRHVGAVLREVQWNKQAWTVSHSKVGGACSPLRPCTGVP